MAASIWLKDANNCLRAHCDVNAGRIWFNTVLEDWPETRLGGRKESDLGLQAEVMGIKAYTKVKSANMHLGKPWHGFAVYFDARQV